MSAYNSMFQDSESFDRIVWTLKMESIHKKVRISYSFLSNEVLKIKSILDFERITFGDELN